MIPFRYPVLERFSQTAGVPELRQNGMRFSSRRYPDVVAFLAPHGPWAGRTVLDLGGGVGGLSVVLHDQFGGTYDVADFAPFPPRDVAALSEFGLRAFHAADLSRADGLDRLPGGYDAVLLVEVLEHLLVNPVRLFRAIGDHLAPGGMLLVTTPNQARLRNRLQLLLGHSIREPDIFPEDESPAYGHVMEYTLRDLIGFGRRAGLSPIATRVVQNPPGPTGGRLHRWGGTLLNLSAIRSVALGDDLLVLFRKP